MMDDLNDLIHCHSIRPENPWIIRTQPTLFCIGRCMNRPRPARLRLAWISALPMPRFHSFTDQVAAHPREEILRWSNNVARGKKEHRQAHTRAEFIEGSTIGRALPDR